MRFVCMCVSEIFFFETLSECYAISGYPSVVHFNFLK
jgi:hypothetical protein